MTGSEATRFVTCNCGSVTLKASGTPIMTVACCCKSCQKAGHQFSNLPNAPTVLDFDDGTHFVMCRKDRVCCVNGQKHLSEHRLKPDSTTRRVVALCCNSAMFLEFEKGHWLSLYKNRFEPDDQRSLGMRTMTKDRRQDGHFNDNIPSPKNHTLKCMWNLMKAWAAMGFKTPTVDYVNRKTHTST